MERKKIVILDGFAANPGDLSWGEIEPMGDCSVYVRCDSEQEIVERASDAEIILTNKSVISRRVMEQLPKLKYIAVQATGYNVVDIQAARERGVHLLASRRFAVGARRPEAFARLAISSPQSEEELSRGLRTVKELIEEGAGARGGLDILV